MPIGLLTRMMESLQVGTVSSCSITRLDELDVEFVDGHALDLLIINSFFF